MPIEIRELVIRTVVEPERLGRRAPLQEEELERLKRQVVAECLERLAGERQAKTKR